MYGVSPPEMYQGGPNVNGPRMMQPIPYPYPTSQSGQQNPAMPPNGYAFQPMMPHPPSANGGVSPSSPTSGTPMQMPPYPPYGMWYPAPHGMTMQGPPGVMPAAGMPPMIPMGHFPPHGAMYPPPPQQQNVGETQNPAEAANQQQQQQQQQAQHPQNGEQPNGAGWTPGPGGLPPKEVAQTILCR
jgi:hypothetical protein